MASVFDKGTRIDQYVILERIHRGGKSDIYFADDPKNYRKVALKVFHADQMSPEQKDARLVLAEKLTDPDHPGLAGVYGAFEFESSPVIVLEFCEGQSLNELLKNFEATPQKAIEVIVQVLEALDFAHKNDLCHGPLLPSQVIIGLDGRARLIGFDELTEYIVHSDGGKSKPARHPEYTAPEVLDGAEPDIKSDLFSVGVLLYELLTGESPFRGDNREESAELVKAHTPTAPSKVRPELPYRLDNIIQRLLGKDPEHRYQNAAEAASDLRAIGFDDDSSVKAKPPVDWWNRYVVPAAALVLIIIALLWLLR
jgi:serine/threonine-protein kinase